MGRIINNVVTKGFSGSLGKDLVFRQIGDKTFFAKKGYSNKKASPAQKGRRLLLAAANIHATLMLQDPEKSEWYSIFAKVNGLNKAHIAAVKDFMTKPEIESINTKAYKGNVGDVIHITPKLLLKVTKIDVTIYRADGSILETGHATKRDFHWQYTATAANPHVDGTRIVLVAHDRLRKSCRFTEHVYDDVKSSFVASSNSGSSTSQRQLPNISEPSTQASLQTDQNEFSPGMPISESQKSSESDKANQSLPPVRYVNVSRQTYREPRSSIASQAQQENSVQYLNTQSPSQTMSWGVHTFQPPSCTHSEESLSFDKYV